MIYNGRLTMGAAVAYITTIYENIRFARMDATK